MKSKWCEYPKSSPRRFLKNDTWRPGPIDPKRYPRKRMSCPVCGHRLIACSVYDHDGDFCGYAIPRHKVSSIKPKKPSRKTGPVRSSKGRSQA
jgi:hypothetical protein